MKKIAVPLFLAMALAAFGQGEPSIPDLTGSFGEDSLGLVLGASATYDGDFSTAEKGGITYFSPNFSALALLELNGDGQYANSLNVGNNYFLLDAGGMAATFGDFTLRGGQLPIHDAVDSPYSLFVNGKGLTAMVGEFRFERGAFSYESRWIGLNHHVRTDGTAFDSYANSAGDNYYPERGASLKTYALTFGSMSFGLQDVAVYSGRYFDVSYFLDPMPNYFIQYVNNRAGRPWYSDYDDNDIIGAFWTWQATDDLDVYAQVLIDDFSVFGLLGYWSNNPWKAAWSLGGTLDTDLGSFGFYHAGATKYCFEPTYETAGREYGYTYYPDTVFYIDGSAVAIPFDQMMVGYQHGENNLAFMATWADVIEGFGLGASLEFTLSGSKSPANAWHEATMTDYTGTKMLDESVFEKKILFSFGGSRSLGAFDLFLEGQLGYVFNELELVATTPVLTVVNGKTYGTQTYSSLEIWKPSDTNRFLYSMTIGGRFRLGIIK